MGIFECKCYNLDREYIVISRSTMIPIATEYKHIQLDAHSVPILNGCTMKVVELIQEYLAEQLSPETLQICHPELTMGQIYSALAYYWDRKDEMDTDIQRRLKIVEGICIATPPSKITQYLVARS